MRLETIECQSGARAVRSRWTGFTLCRQPWPAEALVAEPISARCPIRPLPSHARHRPAQRLLRGGTHLDAIDVLGRRSIGIEVLADELIEELRLITPVD